MKRIDTELDGVCVLEPEVHGDHRGFFLETYNRAAFEAVGIGVTFVQDNYSRSRGGVVRGLHYQLPCPQDKLVRVTAGEVFDVAADIRVGSPTFGRWVGVTLTAENFRMLFVPRGFAHGFCVVSATAEFAYKCSDFYAPQHERGIIWNDPTLAIDWPLAGIAGGAPILSQRDQTLPRLEQCRPDELPKYGM